MARLSPSRRPYTHAGEASRVGLTAGPVSLIALPPRSAQSPPPVGPAPRPQPGPSAPPHGCGPARSSHERASPDGKMAGKRGQAQPRHFGRLGPTQGLMCRRGPVPEPHNIRSTPTAQAAGGQKGGGGQEGASQKGASRQRRESLPASRHPLPTTRHPLRAGTCPLGRTFSLSGGACGSPGLDGNQ